MKLPQSYPGGFLRLPQPYTTAIYPKASLKLAILNIQEAREKSAVRSITGLFIFLKLIKAIITACSYNSSPSSMLLWVMAKATNNQQK